MRNAAKLTLALFSLVFLFTLVSCNGKKSTDSDSVHFVRVAKVAKGVLAGGTVVSGKLEGLETADIVPKIAGRVAKIPVDIGSRVQAGDILFSLDNAELAAAVNQMEAGLALAEASSEVSRVNYERGKRLLEEGAISQADFDARFELAYKTGVQQVAQTGAAVNAARANYSNTIVTAPFSGVVTNRKVNPGEMATQQAPVVSLVNISRVVVRTIVNEDTVNKLKEGQKVPVKVSAVRSETFEGTITNIALAAENSSKGYPVKVQVNNPDMLLKPGMFAEVQLSMSPNQCLLAPREAVINSSEGSYVYIVKDGVAQKIAVITGNSDGNLTEIISGLEEGREVIVEGAEGLVDGSKVQVNI